MESNGLLKECDYLSTVSGGGYIGSWFAAWLRRASWNTDEPRESLRTMQRRLSPTRSPDPMDARSRPIRYLREYSNYLTPRAGLLSADTWTMLGIYLRNTLLNQTILVSLMAAALLLPRDGYALVRWLATQTRNYTNWIVLGLLAVGTGFLLRNLRNLETRVSKADIGDPDRPNTASRTQPRWYATPTTIQWGTVAPWLCAAALWMHELGRSLRPLANQCTPGFACAFVAPEDVPLLSEAPLSLGAVVFLVLAVSLFYGKAASAWSGTKPGPEAWARLRARSAMLSAALIGGIVASCLGWAVDPPFLPQPARPLLPRSVPHESQS